MDVKDYKNYDYLTVLAKKDELDNVLAVYENLSWEQVEQSEDSRYEDTLIITFRRKHKIKNKPKLQLLQVRMEMQLEKMEKIDKNKFKRSITIGVFASLLLLTLLSLGIYFLAKGTEIYIRFGGIISIIISVILLVLLIVKLNFIVNDDKQKYKAKMQSINENLEKLFDGAKKLVGGKADGDK